MLGGCYNLAKSRASWSRIYVAAMTPEEMTAHAADAFHAARIGRFQFDPKYDARFDHLEGDQRPAPMYYGTSFSEHFVTQTPEWSLTMLWRRGVWLVTGAPTCIIFAIPTLGLSLYWLSGPVNLFGFPQPGFPQSVGEALGRNTAHIWFHAEEIIPGLSVASCEIESMGMVSDARVMKNALWRELGSRFPQDGLLEWVPPEPWPVPPVPHTARFPPRAPKPTRNNQEPSLSK
jgi:hypothetical protein